MEQTEKRRNIWRDLPGEAAVDAALVARVAGELRSLKATSELESGLRLGRLLLEAFFTESGRRLGEVELTRRAKRHQSWRALASRPDLPFSVSHLHRVVGVVLVHEVLPPAVRAALSFSHHRALVALPHSETRLALAEQAVEQGWTTRQLEVEVRRWRAAHGLDGVGRPALSALERQSRAVERVVVAMRTLVRSQDLDLHGRAGLAEVLDRTGRELLELAGIARGGGGLTC